jgi:hypothetical protein
MEGFVCLQINLDVKFDEFMNTFRDEARVDHGTSQMLSHDVLAAVEQLKNDFCQQYSITIVQGTEN